MGIFLFGFLFNWLTAMLSLATIVFYGFFYTLWLKPKTYFNIVIGGIAGAMAPVGVWAAATGSVSLSPLILFLIIFFWTPPHFWALALFYKDDYRQVGLPMLPVAKGDLQTSKQIFYYSIFLFVVSMLLLAVPKIGWIYMLKIADNLFRSVIQKFTVRCEYAQRHHIDADGIDSRLSAGKQCRAASAERVEHYFTRI